MNETDSDILEAIERTRAALAEFDEADAVELKVYYRVSPRFVNDVRRVLANLPVAARVA